MITMKKWMPSEKEFKNSNISRVMEELSINSYADFYRWSVDTKKLFWEKTIDHLGIAFDQKYSSIVDTSQGIENAKWLYGAKLNIVDSCFQNKDESIALIMDDGYGEVRKISQKELLHSVNSVANGFNEMGLIQGDTVAIFMSMNFEAVVLYLGAIKAGLKVATIADSFSKDEIAVRLKITEPKLICTQDGFKRGERTHFLYDKCKGLAQCVVVNCLDNKIKLEHQDLWFSDFLSSDKEYISVKVTPDFVSTILFSSGTTGEPKAIPWDQTTPIKSASDGFYHHNIQKGDVVCWPTNLGWMMGPWLVFATLINKGTVALYSGSPLEKGFGKFVEKAEVSMLGLVPSIVNAWKLTGAMEEFDWNAIECFSSTGEVSNPEEMEYLMDLAGGKPIIEYCGGTEIGGGYIASTFLQENIPSQFSTQTLGGEFVLLDEHGKESEEGEVFIIPPILGLSTQLLNRNHHEVYYKNVPKYKGKILRRHGDALCKLKNGYFKANGRVDDAMNLGGIKVSSVQIESVLNSLSFIKECAAIAVSPKNGGPSALVVYFVAQNTIERKEALKKVQNCIKTKLNPLFKVIDLVKIDNLPRTASKKVKRKELRNTYQNL